MYYSLSPSYFIRNEKHCSYIAVCNSALNQNNQGFVAFPIPPFMGYILEEIGHNELEKSLNVISQRLNVTKQSIETFTCQLLDNDDNKKFKLSANASITLPKGVLIRSHEAIIVNSYRSHDFNPLDSFIEKRPSIPFSINLMITNKCTTDCIYCYANRTLSPILSTDKVLKLIKEMHNEGVINLTITGGDVFTRPDWPQILKCAKEEGYSPFLSTKTPLNNQQLDYLKSIGYSELQFSLDCVENYILKELINVTDDYLIRVKSMFEYCDRIGINLLVRSVLTNRNASINSLSCTYNFLSQFSVIKEWALTPAFFSEYKHKTYKSYEVSNESLKEAYAFANRDNLKFKITLNKINSDGYKLKKSQTVEDFVCQNQICMANTTSLSILSNGTCSVCEMLYDHPEFLIGDVSINSIKAIWNSEKALSLYNAQVKYNKESFSPCFTCSMIEKCKKGFGKRICYVDIAKTGGNPNSPDPRCPKACEYDIIL